MSTPQRFRLIGIAALWLLGAGASVRAESFSYQGQIQIQSRPGDPCSATSSETSFNIYVYGRDDSPQQRFDGYLYGEKIVHAHFSGNNLERLSLTYLGESSAAHVLRLRVVGDGAFVGELQAKTLVAALVGCKFADATVKFTKVATHTPEAFERAANLFELDMRSVQAYVQGLQGKVKEALPVLQEALAIKEKALPAGHSQLLPNYYFLGQLHLVEGSYPDAVTLDRKAVAVCEQAYGPESLCAGLMQTSLGEALVNTGNNSEAQTSLLRAQVICDKVCDPEAPFRGTLLNSLGAVLINIGRFGEAEVTLNRALEFNKKAFGTGNANVGLSLINLGILFRLTGQYSKAEAAVRQALAIDQKALGPRSPLVILNSIVLAQILRISGRTGEAEPLCRSALASAMKVLGPERPDHPALGMGLNCLAEVLRETRRYGEAEPLYRQALANSLKYLGPDSPDVGMTSLLLASLLRATGRDDEALMLLKRAYRIAHVSGNQTITWRAPSELMRLYGAGKTAQPIVAIFYGKEAVNNLQQLRGNLTGSSSETQKSFVSATEVNSVYRNLADLLVGQGRLSEAQQVLAMLKEQEFYDFTQRGADSTSPKTVASLNSPEKELDDLNTRIVSQGKEMGALQEKYQKDHQLSPADHERLKVLRVSMDKAQANFDTRTAAVAKSSADPEAQKRRNQEISDWSRSFQGTLKELGHDAVLAQYFIQDDHVTILLTTPNALVAREAPIKRQDLNEQIRAFRKSLSSPSQDPLPQAKALYLLLVGPIAEDLRQAGTKTLMLSLDDTLRYLPFAALHDGKGYLVEK